MFEKKKEKKKKKKKNVLWKPTGDIASQRYLLVLLICQNN